MSRAEKSLIFLFLSFSVIAGYSLNESIAPVHICVALMLCSYVASVFCNRSWRAFGKSLPEIYEEIKRGKATEERVIGVVLLDLTFVLMLITIAVQVTGG